MSKIMLNTTPRNKQIRIKVLAKDLWNKAYAVEFDPAKMEKIVDDCTSLIEIGGNMNQYGDPNKDFEIKIYDGFTLEWSIESDDEGYKPILEYITQVEKLGSKGFFTSNLLQRNPDGNIVGTVSAGDNTDLTVEDYTITFHILKAPNAVTPFPILLDPKLQMKT